MASPIRSVLSWFSRRFRSTAKILSKAVHDQITRGASAKDAVNQAWDALGFGQFLDQMVKQSVQVSFHKNAPPLLKAPTGAWDPSGMTLSQKLHGASTEMRQKIVSTIQEQQKLNHHAMQAARALYDGYNARHVVRKQPLPKYLSQIVTFARRSYLSTAEYDSLLRKVRKAQGLVDKLGQNGAPNRALRSAYNELLQNVVTRSQDALERAVKTACEEKSRYVAERIARTESARAWADGFIERYANDDSVVAYQWKLASRHPEYDICNLYAEANLWGLGAGVFPKDKTPDLPVHPHCLCHLAPIYASELKGKKAVDKVEKAGRAWIERQTLGHQQALLGVKGQKLFERGAGWRSQARNYSPKYLGIRNKTDQAPVKSGIIKLKIDGYNNAVIPLAKLTQYALNPQKAPDKAKAFKLALGYDLDNVNELLENVSDHINDFPVELKPDNGYGQRFQILLDVVGANGKKALILTAWIVDTDKDETRLTSIYVKNRKE